jgi:hypothetical protein
MASGLNIKHTSNRAVLKIMIVFTALALIALVVFYGVRWYATGDLPPFPVPVAAAGQELDESEVTATMRAAHKIQGAQPRYISIPLLGVDAARIQVAKLSSNRILEMPFNIHDAAWYDASANPGMGAGVVLLSGRSGGISKPGIFAGIETLPVDSDIIVERGDGESVAYKLHDARTMSIQDLNNGGMQEMMEPIEGESESLSMIISTGNWVPKIQEYDRRILVRATVLE